MPANVLALFAVKAPVEPTAPTQDQANDNGFKDFMDTAVHKVDTAQKPSKEDSPQNQNNTQAEKTQPKAKTAPILAHRSFKDEGAITCDL
ncbi:MAG TPA: hypothetical protein EYP74_01425 [Anaerolineales bacterium]|nr:hypothetical protein [Anaerolineales bacterium]